jgi:hypothetical protein
MVMITNAEFQAELALDYTKYSGWDFTTYDAKDTTMNEDIAVLNDFDFRLMLSDSLESKRLKYDELRQAVEKMKIDLRVVVEKTIEREYSDEPEKDKLLNALWDWLWFVMSHDDIAELKRLASQMRNLRMALRYARSLAGVDEKKYKNGYSPEQIQDADDVSVVDFVDAKVRVTGSKIITRCPFHDEKTGSFVIYSDNSWHCFGCQAHGMGAIDFIKKKYNFNFVDAVKYLLGV